MVSCLNCFLVFQGLDKAGARQELDEIVSCLNYFLIFYILDKAGARQELDEMVVFLYFTDWIKREPDRNWMTWFPVSRNSSFNLRSLGSILEQSHRLQYHEISLLCTNLSCQNSYHFLFSTYNSINLVNLTKCLVCMSRLYHINFLEIIY